MNTIITKFKKLPFTNNYIFSRIIHNFPELSIPLVKMCTGIDIDEVTIAKEEWSIAPDFDAKSIRLDAYVKSLNRHIDIEMQTTRDEAIFKRARYYNDILDVESLSKGEEYSALPDVIIIFICLFDPLPPFNALKYEEKIRMYADDKDVTDKCSYDSGCVRMYLNAKADVSAIKDKRLRALVEYINTEKCTDEFTKELEFGLNAVRNSRKEQERFMTLQYELDRYVKDHQDEWYKEGIQEGKTTLIQSMYAKGISVNDIADIANMSIEEVKEILSANNKTETN